MWIEPIYDRVSRDVENVKSIDRKIKTIGWDALDIDEKNEYLDGLKGALNAIDLNRIERNTYYLSEELEAHGYYAILEPIKTDWDKSDFPTISELERVRANVRSLKTAFYSHTQVPDDIDRPTYQKINALEKVHAEILELIGLMIDSFRYSGEFYSGEDYSF